MVWDELVLHPLIGGEECGLGDTFSEPERRDIDDGHGNFVAANRSRRVKHIVHGTKITIRGHNLPGRRFNDGDGVQHDNVHVALQVGRDPSEAVRGDAVEATWETDVRVESGSDGAVDFKGPAVQGKRGERFLYLTWGNVEPDGSFAMFRRAKLMLNRIDPALVTAGALVGAIDLTDGRGGPRCARVDPPALEWTRG